MAVKSSIFNVENFTHEIELFASKAFDSLTDQIVVLNKEGYIVIANNTWISNYNSRKNANNPEVNWVGINYLSVCDVVYGDEAIYATNIAYGIRSVSESKIPFYELEYPCDSQWFSCKVSAFDFNNTTWTIVCHTDITEKRLANIKVKIAAAAFNTQEGMFVTDESSIILKVNQSFCDMTGYTEDEIIGKTPNVLSSGKHDKKFYEEMWSSINGKGFWSGEIWNRFKNGEVFPLHLTITSVKDDNEILTNYVSNLTYITESTILTDEIKNLAFYDPLTHIPNRRLLIDRLQLAINTSERTQKYGVLLLLDLDNFKNLNDTLGHNIGDMLLVETASRLTREIRSGDTVSRFGGDEFVVLLEDISESQFEAAAIAEIISEKILMSIASSYQLSNSEYHITSSIGITLFKGFSGGYEELLKQADIAMYQAKCSGRNALRFFDPEMQEAINRKVKLESEIETALSNNQFELYYQIQVNNLDEPVGAEALLRWNHPEIGLVSPEYFIQTAEESGKISKIDNWVIDAVCNQVNKWSKTAHLKELTISLNVSAPSFSNINFVENIKNYLRKHAAEPSKIKIELTESSLVDNVNRVIESMDALEKVGVKFSLDDFGTGYSSLQYLKKLPFDQLKIDQSFVKDLATDCNDRSIVRTIIAMANSMAFEVIAEGVETEIQRSLLIDKGCKLFQGYFFCKPLCYSEFEEFIIKNKA